jgi:hypothetical protein
MINVLPSMTRSLKMYFRLQFGNTILYAFLISPLHHEYTEFLAYFPYWRIEAGLWDHLIVCVCVCLYVYPLPSTSEFLNQSLWNT